ncbi:hypothetical protein SAMN02927921_04181 [Sinomicrobium oceani]|uniref:Uncharacterized protein n=1 Tax=Sinomicrobium oceani TaxID=1150368 RepID=A0A1K1RYU6_9FLAO|nr:hypothetical protein [Sinomicrobium oceani]SFW76980.1 hypothetical protein SAMN02927921_04181 [Sinomicrobium oceani]
MKRILLFLLLGPLSFYAQVITTNRNPVGLEHNILFRAENRYTVTQTGTASLPTARLFDGKLTVNYTSTPPGFSDPTVILIEGLPAVHTQVGGWVGWSTRHWGAVRFKIEGYDTFGTPNGWRVLADYSGTDYNGNDFVAKVAQSGRYIKLRYTFYTGSAGDGRLGVSELFFIHPEATSPYEGLYQVTGSDGWESGNGTLFYEGNVGIGTMSPDSPLAVNGVIHSKEVRVDLEGWSDFVFEEDYDLPTLEEVEAHIKEKGHLKDIPGAREVKENGVLLGEMDAKLLQKIEELTLYTIQQQKLIETLLLQNKKQQEEIDNLKK